jgi:hypothetical protein
LIFLKIKKKLVIMDMAAAVAMAVCPICIKTVILYVNKEAPDKGASFYLEQVCD